jgi:hypothetical protein
VHSPGGTRTGAVNLEPVTSLLTEKVLSKNASRGITVAKNEDFVRRVGVHQPERGEVKAFTSCANIGVCWFLGSASAGDVAEASGSHEKPRARSQRKF